MTKRPNHRNGYSKKELIEIIKKIDIDQNKRKIKTEKQNADRGDNGSHFLWNMGRADK